MSAPGAVPSFAALVPVPAVPEAGEDGTCTSGPVPGTTVPDQVPVPGGSGPVPVVPAGTGEAPATALVPLAEVSRAGAVSLRLSSARDWLAQFWESQRRHRGFGHLLWSWFWETSPETLAAHREHLKSRTWMQDYMTGSVRFFCEWENIGYGILAHIIKFALQTAEKVLERQWRFWAASPLIISVAVWLFMHLSWH